MVKVNYDTGNSASLGYAPGKEFAAYGNRIGSIHIKDRKLGASTVPLGTGNADFETVFREMKSIDYQGDITLQVARGTPGEEVAWARQNLKFIQNYWPR
jgi:hexulose-6-phosphate isomerase